MAKRKGDSAKIIRGLRFAIDLAKGEKSAAKATVYRICHHGERAIVRTKGQPDRIVSVAKGER